MNCFFTYDHILDPDSKLSLLHYLAYYDKQPKFDYMRTLDLRICHTALLTYRLPEPKLN